MFKKNVASWYWLERFWQDPDSAWCELKTHQRNTKLRSLVLMEVQLEGWPVFKEMLSTILSVLGAQVFTETEFVVDFGQASEGSSLEYAILQAFSALKAIGFVALGDVEIFREDGTSLGVSYASSGEQQLLCSLLGLVGSIRNNSIVLVDEPELSLHPKWQIDFSKHIKALLENVWGCHFIIATHSPLVVQGFQEMGCMPVTIDKQFLFSERKFSPKSPVEEILVDVFRSPVPSSLYLTDEIIRLVGMNPNDTRSRFDQIIRLRELKSIYKNKHAEMRLIDRAMKLLEIDDDQAYKSSPRGR